jgi:hypothetical protein
MAVVPALQRRHSLAAPTRGKGPARTFTSRPVRVEFAAPEHRFVRADIEISGIFHCEASYEGRIFLNNPKADAETPKDLVHGYAGSFHIFGHGGCLGDVGHCEVSQHNRESYDFRSPNPLTPAKKRVTVTTACARSRRAARQRPLRSCLSLLHQRTLRCRKCFSVREYPICDL